MPRKGRGSVSNPDGRFETRRHESIDDGWDIPEEGTPIRTTLTPDKAKSIISRNDSPDIPFDQSINPYRGCEHGCVYCFARPTHSYLGLSPGLDFESRLFYKQNAAELLQRELRKPSYTCSPITLGINTDAYQPSERKLKITRSILEVLRDFNHPVVIVTKSALVERDRDILAPMAEKNLVRVMFSITTLDSTLSRRLEPRTTLPARRLQAMQALHDSGIPVGVLVAPLIPVLTDAHMETILESAHKLGADSAGYVILRLPHEVKDLFHEWLAHHEPLKARHVINIIRDMRGGKDYDSKFGERMRGTGEYAGFIAQRFKLVCKRLGLNQRSYDIDSSLFKSPAQSGDQLGLF